MTMPVTRALQRVQGEREIRHPAIYARVSSRDQKRDLESQVSMLKQGYPAAEVYYDISSRLRLDRQGFLNLLRLVQGKRALKVIVTHRDRLARFVFDLVQLMFTNYGPDIEAIKAYTSRVLKRGFLELLKMPTLWTRSYFGRTAVSVSSQLIEEYIEAQKGM